MTLPRLASDTIHALSEAASGCFRTSDREHRKTMRLRSANIIGSGPNGLAAAVTLAQRGIAVTVYERNVLIGGACSTAEVTLPGFRHDLGSSAYPLGIASPFFRTLRLEQFGLRWIQPDAPVAHPLDGGEAMVQEAALDAMSAQLSAHDAKAWRSLFGSSSRNLPKLLEDVTGPMLRLPRHPLITARFGLPALLPAQTIANMFFRDERAKALFAGLAAHSVLPLTHLASAAAALLLGAAGHASGMPVAAGGGQALTDALAQHLRSLGGRILTGVEVLKLEQLPGGGCDAVRHECRSVDSHCGRCARAGICSTSATL